MLRLLVLVVYFAYFRGMSLMPIKHTTKMRLLFLFRTSYDAFYPFENGAISCGYLFQYLHEHVSVSFVRLFVIERSSVFKLESHPSKIVDLSFRYGGQDVFMLAR